MTSKTVWIVDDDQSIRWVLEKALARASIQTRSFSRIELILNALRASSPPDVLISDIRMPEGSGLELLQIVKKTLPNLPVILMTAYADLETTVASFQQGVFDYLPKPFDIEQAVEMVVRAIDQKNALMAKNYSAQTTLMLGQSPVMQTIFRAIAQLANTFVTVLISGDSGTGKTLLARALHAQSQQTQGPFIEISAASLTEQLFELELFGHERGAFEGAHSMRRGYLEQAEGGTLLIEDIDEMPLHLQARLLKVCAERVFYRIGGTYPIQCHLRMIVTTSKHLEALVEQGKFRADLFHRLNAIRLHLPNLRDRREDIPLLLNAALEKNAQILGIQKKVVSQNAIDYLIQYSWLGNVRELENLAHWMSLMCLTEWIELNEVKAYLATVQVEQGTSSMPVPYSVPMSWQEALRKEVNAKLQLSQNDFYHVMLDHFEEIVFKTTLEYTRGRKHEAARKLGIGRNTLTRKLKIID